MPLYLPYKNNTVARKLLLLMQYVKHTIVHNFVALTQALLIGNIVKQNEWHIPPTRRIIRSYPTASDNNFIILLKRIVPGSTMIIVLYYWRNIEKDPNHGSKLSRLPSSKDLLSLKMNPVTAISELKCEEYVGEIAGTSFITFLTGSSLDVRKVINTCGSANRLVIGGTEARIDEFPHMVALGKRNANEFILMCGGTLISHTWVISAAHCTHGTDGGVTDARIGFHSLKDQKGITIVIKDIKTHPDYKPPALYADIALLQLMTSVTFSTSIRPACLYQFYDTVPTQAWVSGWGVTEYGGEVSDRLQKAKLDLVDNLSCTVWHNSSTEVPYGITPSMICASDSRSPKDTCQGDSGGPLQIVHPTSECLFQLIGITSFGQGCGMIDIPGVYTRVSHYLSWIETIVWPQE